MKNIAVKGILALSLIYFSGCSSKDELAPTQKIMSKDNKSVLMDHYKPNTIEVKKTFISFNRPKKVSELLKELSEIDGKSYFLDSKDIEVRSIPNYKAYNFKDINNLIKNTTNYELDISKNRVVAGLPKRVEIKEQVIATDLDRIFFDGKKILVPSDVFSNLSSYTRDWQIIDTQDVKDVFTKQQHMTFKGSLRELIDYFARNNDLYVDYDYKNKQIIFSKYKQKEFRLKAITESIDFNNNIKVDINNDDTTSTSTTDTDNETGVKVKSKYDLMGNLEKSLKLIVPENSTNEYVRILQELSMVIAKTTPKKMKDIETQINAINNEAFKKLYIKVSMIEVNLDKQYQYGINWGYVKSYLTDGAVSKVVAGATNGSIPGLTTELVQPSILKIANSNGVNAVFNSLNQFGDTAISFQVPVFTLNNIPAIYDLSGKDGYVKDFKLENTGTDGSSYLAPSQDKIASGNYLYIKPTIFDEEILISLKLVFSRLKNLEKQEFRDGQYIQTPSTDDKKVSQNIVIRNGEKIIVGGIIMRTEEKNYDGASPYNKSDWNALLGVKGNVSQNKEIILMIEAKQL
jgi:type II secretory pathway component GspD/PulD (secretin)